MRISSMLNPRQRSELLLCIQTIFTYRLVCLAVLLTLSLCFSKVYPIWMHSTHHIHVLATHQTQGVLLLTVCYLLRQELHNYGVENVTHIILFYCTRYVVQCDPGKMLWYTITDHDLQGRVIDPTNNQSTCVDFLGEYALV